MPFNLTDKPFFTRRFFRANIALGLTITMVALYLIFTGDYATYQARKAGEAVLNRYVIGGLIYMALVWSACQFGKPFMKSRSKS